LPPNVIKNFRIEKMSTYKEDNSGTADVIHTAGRVYKKVSNDEHARPCANSNTNPNPNLGRVPCLVFLYIRPAVCIVTM